MRIAHYDLQEHKCLSLVAKNSQINIFCYKTEELLPNLNLVYVTMQNVDIFLW